MNVPPPVCFGFLLLKIANGCEILFELEVPLCLQDHRPHLQYLPFAQAAQAENFRMRPGSALWKTYQGGHFGSQQQPLALEAPEADGLQA